MQADSNYMTASDGFTSVFPNTPEAEREYNRHLCRDRRRAAAAMEVRLVPAECSRCGIFGTEVQARPYEQ